MHESFGSSELGAANALSTKQPAVQARVMQIWPLPHGVPSAIELHKERSEPGWHDSQMFVGFGSSGDLSTPSMKQLLPQFPLLQSCALPQAVPGARFVHALAVTPGWHDSQGLLGLRSPVLRKAPST